MRNGGFANAPFWYAVFIGASIQAKRIFRPRADAPVSAVVPKKRFFE